VQHEVGVPVTIRIFEVGALPERGGPRWAEPDRARVHRGGVKVGRTQDGDTDCSLASEVDGISVGSGPDIDLGGESLGGSVQVALTCVKPDVLVSDMNLPGRDGRLLAGFDAYVPATSLGAP